jgi:non-ribosomal peptide synthetase component E (peptide arylation enzyme)
VDVLKTGGYKLSALDVERELLEHPGMYTCMRMDDTCVCMLWHAIDGWCL